MREIKVSQFFFRCFYSHLGKMNFHKNFLPSVFFLQMKWQKISINLNIPSFIYLNIIKSTCILYHLKWLNLQIVSISRFFELLKNFLPKEHFKIFFSILFFNIFLCIWTSIARKKKIRTILSTFHTKILPLRYTKSIKRIFLKREKKVCFPFYSISFWTFCEYLFSVRRILKCFLWFVWKIWLKLFEFFYQYVMRSFLDHSFDLFHDFFFIVQSGIVDGK